MREEPFRFRREYDYPEAIDVLPRRKREGDRYVDHVQCPRCGEYRGRLLTVVLEDGGPPVLERGEWIGPHSCR